MNNSNTVEVIINLFDRYKKNPSKASNIRLSPQPQEKSYEKIFQFC